MLLKNKIFWLVFLAVILSGVFFIYKYKLADKDIFTASIFDKVSASEECRKLSNQDGSYSQCWNDLIERSIKEWGIDAAMELIAYMYDSDPSSGGLCHGLTHLVGERSYDLFVENKNFKITDKTRYCSYGFYHGFMEVLVATTGDPKLARDFCKNIGDQLSKTAPDAYLQCYHGIGHGWANDHSGKKISDPNLIIKPALALCEQVTSDKIELSRCATGVFNAMAIFAQTGEYDFTIAKKDPLKLCREQEEKYQYACYISMNVPLRGLFGDDIYAAGKFIQEIKDDNNAIQAMINLGATYSMSSSKDDKYYVNQCRRFEKRLIVPCIQGYAFGFMENGPPGTEYVKPLDLCMSDWFNEEEVNGCLNYIFGYLPQWYSKEKVQEICNGVNSVYRQQCHEKISIR